MNTTQITKQPLLLVANIIFLITLFVNKNMLEHIVILAFAILYLVYLTRQFPIYKSLVFILFSLPLTLATWLSASVFLLKDSNYYSEATFFTFHLWSISYLGWIYIVSLDFEEIIFFLLQKKFIGVKIGYSLLAILNSFVFMKEEYQRIQIAYMMRYGKKSYNLLVLFTLLVSASRYANNISLSLHSRGLNDKKTYIGHRFVINLFDVFYSVIYFICLFILLVK